MKGFYHKILNIDLSLKNSHVESVDKTVYERYLGGKGLATKLLLDCNPPGVDPLDPGNRVIFATGAMAGSPVWGSSRYGVFTKSPLTGFYSESYSGGRVAEAISATGFDAIVITGQAPSLTVLEITPEGVVFHDADMLAGKDTFETETMVSKQFGSEKKRTRQWKTGVVVTGPAAENLCRFAIIKNDGWRCAGRTGTGTVIGSKRIKAVIFSGDQKRKLYDPGTLSSLAGELAAESRDNPVVHAYKTMGTSQMVAVMNRAGACPGRSGI